MKLLSTDLFLLSQCAISAAYQAGRVISAYKHRQVSTNSKEGGSSLASQVVTEVDHLSQDIILQTLLPTCELFDLALLTEESADDRKRLEKDYFWCIDPLDGTLPFVESTPGYAVSIALVSRKGRPYIGIVYDPLEDVLYSAVKGCGAFRNGKPWELDFSPTNPKSFAFITDRSFKQHRLFSHVLSELKKIAVAMGFDDVRTILHGGAAMNACWVLENVPACYFKFPKRQQGGGSLWDYAATACIFLEVGAVVSDVYGEPLDLNRAESTFLNHCGVLYASDHDLSKKILDLYVRLQNS